MAMSTAIPGAAGARELQRGLRVLCREYEDVLDESAELTQPIDERVGLALFKIDEATALAQTTREGAAESQRLLLEALADNCRELEDLFIRINLMESFISKVQTTTKELERRLETIQKAADPVLSTGSVTTLLRSLSIKRPTSDPSAPTNLTWEPLDVDLRADDFLERLDRSSAEELGVSIIGSRLG